MSDTTDELCERMKIVIVCDLLSTFLRFRRFLAIRMMEAGHDVTVIASENDANETDFFREHSAALVIVKMDRTSLNPLSDLSYYRRLKAEIVRIQPSHVLAYQAKAAVWTAIAARSIKQCHTSVLFPGLGYLFSPVTSNKQRIVQLISRRLYGFGFRKIQSAIFQNQDDIETLQQYGLISSSTKVSLVNGSGVCLEEFPFTPAPLAPLRFVMATRLLADKGIREFAEVAGQVVEQHGDRVQFQIAGGFDTNPTAIKESEMKQWESQGWITYRGQVTDMVQFLREASVFVLPSYYMEGTPRSILEAMSIGRAIITTDNRGCRETVEDGVNGFLVAQKDRSSLKVAMETFVQSPDLATSFGNKSRELAEKKYDVNLVCDQMIAAMQL